MEPFAETASNTAMEGADSKLVRVTEFAWKSRCNGENATSWRSDANISFEDRSKAMVLEFMGGAMIRTRKL